MKLFTLKTIAAKKDYPSDTCAASRCMEPSAVIDESGKFWKRAVPLCERHWTHRCECEPVQVKPKRAPVLVEVNDG